LVAVSKRLSVLEDRYHMTFENFYDNSVKGQLEDSIDFVEWANDYQHYLAISARHDPEKPEGGSGYFGNR